MRLSRNNNNNNNNNNKLQISIYLSDTADIGFIRTRHVWGLVWTKTLRPLERDSLVAEASLIYRQMLKSTVMIFKRSLLQGPEESSRKFPLRRRLTVRRVK
jgi:hypothetical protein